MTGHGIPNGKGGRFVPKGGGSGEIVQKSGSTIDFYSVTQKKSIPIPRSQVTFTKNKRGKPVMIAKDAGVKKDGTRFNLYRIGHI